MKTSGSLRPAFESDRSAAVFGFSLALLLTLPVLLLAIRRPLAEDVYAAVPHRVGPFGFFEKMTYGEKGPIDVLFLGPSYSWNAIDARIVKNALSARLHREAIVYNFGSNWRGEDLYYTLFREITARRRVRLAIINLPLPMQGRNEPHQMAHYWMLFGRDREAEEGLSVKRRLQLYALNLLGAPRHVIGLIRSDLPQKDGGEEFGSYPVPLNYDRSPFKVEASKPPLFTSDETTYSLTGDPRARVTGPAAGDFQAHFIRKLFDLAQRRGVPMASIYLPLYDLRALNVIEDREYWPSYTKDRLTMIGVPNAKLFGGLTGEQITRLYYDNHLNANGMDYFTRAVLPGILKAYDEAVDHSPFERSLQP